MEQNQLFFYDFVEGRITIPEFLEEIGKKPELLQWLQNIVADWDDEEVTVDLSMPNGIRRKKVPYDVYRKLQELKDSKRSELTYQLNLRGWIAKIMRIAFPDNPPVKDLTLANRYSFLLEVCPSYIDGGEVEEIIAEIIDSIPKELSKTAAKKWAREQIIKSFHIEGQHYPRWIQGPEWPAYEGRPMKYVRTEKLNQEAQNHYFVDLVTGTERVVFDAY